jgi:hypothetical protein
VSKINVHPDHYKVGGRDRQDDAAAARLARAKAAKATSQKRPDRMAKKPWFPRTEAKPAAVASPKPEAKKLPESARPIARKPGGPGPRATAGRGRPGVSSKKKAAAPSRRSKTKR